MSKSTSKSTFQDSQTHVDQQVEKVKETPIPSSSKVDSISKFEENKTS
jgi:hypothetical protein